ncbi:MAG: NFYB/HAP3 family transcription factor subunit [Candidatus Aenigmarchaeota archaeon]|nr:NFYB/HAP3 family transcription factor subunit [Candidatus Aenigmarchaeota archaeon]MCK5235059.1 NFYB/HAP3 family transcription factor subunit [Candidatus Aenigmarchaeota archaeon]
MAELSLASVEKIFRDANAKRVSVEASKELRKVIEDFADDIGKEAVKAAEHTGRKTVKEADIRFVTKQS